MYVRREVPDLRTGPRGPWQPAQTRRQSPGRERSPPAQHCTGLALQGGTAQFTQRTSSLTQRRNSCCCICYTWCTMWCGAYWNATTWQSTDTPQFKRAQQPLGWSFQHISRCAFEDCNRGPKQSVSSQPCLSPCDAHVHQPVCNRSFDRSRLRRLL